MAANKSPKAGGRAAGQPEGSEEVRGLPPGASIGDLFKFGDLIAKALQIAKDLLSGSAGELSTPWVTVRLIGQRFQAKIVLRRAAAGARGDEDSAEDILSDMVAAGAMRDWDDEMMDGFDQRIRALAEADTGQEESSGGSAFGPRSA